MVQASPVRDSVTQWVDVCALSDIVPNTGVCAMVKEEQVAIFRVGNEAELYAISNYDPFSKAFVMSRGIVGDRNGIKKVAAPIYKQNFNLATGECLDDETVKIATYSVRVTGDRVEVGIN
ncbi:MAG: nitrite reductase small subunit NirD [Oscillatoria sp. SIO1A7]|nr:nitrite reductase small subunit NirD [Oscillatoria sp. SIO1A7]